MDEVDTAEVDTAAMDTIDVLSNEYVCVLRSNPNGGTLGKCLILFFIFYCFQGCFRVINAGVFPSYLVGYF